MRKLLTALAIAAALTGMISGTAAADTQRTDGQIMVSSGVAGYFKTKDVCLAQRAVMDLVAQVGHCQKNAKGWYFKFT